MESSTDLCFGERKMAAERCTEAHTGAEPLHFCPLLAPIVARPNHPKSLVGLADRTVRR